MLNEIQKRACVETLIASGLPADQAQIAVDLADHAVQTARETFIRALRPTPNLAVGLAATQIASQLAMQSFRRLAALSLSEQFAGNAPTQEIHLDGATSAKAPTQEAAQ